LRFEAFVEKAIFCKYASNNYSTGKADLAEERKREERKKGCGLGYALAVNSCEGVSSVDACTVAAPDAITALAVPNPSCSSQGSWFFRVWWLNESPRRANHPAYFGPVKYYLDQPFQPSTFTG